MKVIWDPDALKEFKRIIDYINDNYGKKSAQKFTNQVIKTRKTIETNPASFKIEELIQKRKNVYRSANVNKINRLIYYVDNDIVHISDIWDNRRDPEKLNK